MGAKGKQRGVQELLVPPMDKPRRCIKSLGEVALRVHDLDTIQDFYERVVGQKFMKRSLASGF